MSDLGILPDDYDVIRSTLATAAENHDLIVTSGGVSTGEEDHVRAAVDVLGHMHFWRLAIRPGRPLALGQIGTVPFIGLPGNPVAVLVTFMRFARPAILRLGGCRFIEPSTYRVRTGFPIHKKLGVASGCAYGLNPIPTAARWCINSLRTVLHTDVDGRVRRTGGTA